MPFPAGPDGDRAASRLVVVAKSTGVASASVGFIAAFWHIWWFAGIVVLASSIAGLAAHSAGISRAYFGCLTREARAEALRQGREPGNPSLAW